MKNEFVDKAAKRLKDEIEKSGLSYKDLEQRTGISHSSIQRYAVGDTRKLPITNIQKIADALDISAAYLIGWSDDPHYQVANIVPPTEKHQIPLYSECGAGEYRTADNYIEGYISCDIDADFAVKIDGDSMAPTLQRGDIALVKAVDNVDNGDIAIILNTDTNEAVCKRVMHMPDCILCVSDNEKYEPFRLRNVKILGKVRGLRREF